MGYITPEQLAASGTESGHQKALMQWAASCGIPDMHMLHSVPNGGGRSMSVGALMKAEGVKKGVPDLNWPVPHGVFAGLWIEMKKPLVCDGLSDEQEKWYWDLRRNHYAVAVCYSWIAARSVICDYYARTLVMPAKEILRVR